MACINRQGGVRSLPVLCLTTEVCLWPEAHLREAYPQPSQQRCRLSLLGRVENGQVETVSLCGSLFASQSNSSTWLHRLCPVNPLAQHVPAMEDVRHTPQLFVCHCGRLAVLPVFTKAFSVARVYRKACTSELESSFHERGGGFCCAPPGIVC